MKEKTYKSKSDTRYSKWWCWFLFCFCFCFCLWDRDRDRTSCRGGRGRVTHRCHKKVNSNGSYVTIKKDRASVSQSLQALASPWPTHTLDALKDWKGLVSKVRKLKSQILGLYYLQAMLAWAKYQMSVTFHFFTYEMVMVVILATWGHPEDDRQ